MSDVIDLDAEKQKRKPGRPRKPKEEKAGAKPAGKAAPKEGNLPAIAPTGITVDPRGGVTINWLGDAFDLDPRTVKKRIQGRCRPIRQDARAGGSPVLFYDLRDAARYLVEVPIAELIASATLPMHHDGGIIGTDGKPRDMRKTLRPGEVLMVGEKEEEVITKRDPRHRFNLLRNSLANQAKRYHTGGLIGLSPDNLSASLEQASGSG